MVVYFEFDPSITKEGVSVDSFLTMKITITHDTINNGRIRDTVARMVLCYKWALVSDEVYKKLTSNYAL